MSGLLAFDNILAEIECFFPSYLSMLISRILVLILHVHDRLTCSAARLLLLRLVQVAMDPLQVLAVAKLLRSLREVRTTSA